MFKPFETARGFNGFEFTDRYGERCTIQASSLATEDALWLGTHDPKPQMMKSDACRQGIPTGPGEISGWMDVPLPEGAHTFGRMHLTQEQCGELAAVLQRFADTGEIRLSENDPK